MGAGSTGVVYRAIDEQLDRAVALKVLRPSLGSAARTRFIAEAKSAAAVDHANVITIYQVGEEDQLAFMAMQLLPGETLESRLKRDVFLPEATVRAIAAQIAEGLSAAHAKDLIHRDIKPANVWLDENNNVKILDFGLARVTDDDPGLTSTGMIAGTPCYMSPEQSRGASLDRRSDLFSLGCVLYRASTGRQPFGAVNILSTLQAIQATNPLPPLQTSANVSQEFSDLTMCLLEKLPVNRPESAAQVASALGSDREEWTFTIPEYKSADSDAGTLAAPKKATAAAGSGMGWFGRLATLIAIGLLGFGGYLFGGDVIRIATGHGLLTVETDDPDVKIEVFEAGKRVRIIDTKTEKHIEIKEGKYRLQVAGEDNSIEISPVDLTMTRGGKEIVHITHSPSPESTDALPEVQIRLKHIRAADAALGLNSYFDQAETGAGVNSLPSAPVTVIPDFRSNTVVVKGSRQSIRQAEQFIATIDVDVESASTTPDFVSPDRIEKIKREKIRAGFEKKLSSLSDSIPVDQQETNAQWLDAKLDLAEFDVDAAEQQYKAASNNPRRIATLYARMQQYYELLKRRIRVGAANVPAEGLPGESALSLSTLKTRSDLIQRKLWQFRSMHSLSSNEVEYNGRSLESYLMTARTERSDSQLGEAYVGIAHLVDQFDSRQDFVDFVEESLKRNSSRLAYPNMYQPNGLMGLLSKIQGSELAEMLVRLVTSSETDQQKVAMTVISSINAREIAAVSFRNRDDLFEQLLRTKSTVVTEFLARLTQKSFTDDNQPESQTIRDNITKLLRSKMISSDDTKIRLECTKALADLFADRQRTTRCNRPGFCRVAK